MTPDFSEPHQVLVWMSNYVKTMLWDAPSDMDGVAMTLASIQMI